MQSNQRNARWRRGLLLLAVGIFVISLLLSVWMLRPSDKQMVEIVSDGQVLYTIDLSDTEDREIVIPYSEGTYKSSNTIQIKDGTIRVQDALCPDRTCVKMGKLTSESLPIVCLPNHLTIRFAE